MNILNSSKLSIVLLSVLLVSLSGCGEPEECDQSKVPLYEFTLGEKAIFKGTGESVRVVSEWTLLGSKCDQLYYAKYNVRFFDGAEIEANWSELEKAN